MKNKTNKKAYKNGFQDGWMELIGWLNGEEKNRNPFLYAFLFVLFFIFHFNYFNQPQTIFFIFFLH